MAHLDVQVRLRKDDDIHVYRYQIVGNIILGETAPDCQVSVSHDCIQMFSQHGNSWIFLQTLRRTGRVQEPFQDSQLSESGTSASKF